MLKLYMKQSLLHKEGFEAFVECQTLFDYQFSDEWLTPAVTAALEGIDRGKYLGNYTFVVEHLGAIPHSGLSGGFKTLAAIRNINPRNWVDPAGHKHIGELLAFPSSYMGGNVFPYLDAVIDELDYDIDMEWVSTIKPQQWGDAKIDAMIMDLGVRVSSWAELCEQVIAHPELMLPYEED